MKNYKKLDYSKHENEEFKMKDYMSSMNLKDARTKFAIDNRMVATIKSDFPSDPEYADKL